MSSIGWDIGGVNVKVACAGDGGTRARTVPLALESASGHLADLVRVLAGPWETPGTVHGITMTGELSQRFVTKAEGVDFILSAMEEALPGRSLQVLTTDGQFVAPAAARREPLLAAASNWVATALAVAETFPNAIVVDMGSTTTDIIPVVGGTLAARGRTDPERLGTSELVYTGMVRTPADALVAAVPFQGRLTRTAPDGFALVADAHLWAGTLAGEDCASPMADGRAATREAAGHRLARLVCADRALATDEDLSIIARGIIDAQLHLLARAIETVHRRHPGLGAAVVLGLGEGTAGRAAELAGLEPVRLSTAWGEAQSVAAPAVAVARLVAQRLAPCASR